MLSAKKVLPGKKGQIEIKINTENLSGAQNKQIPIATNDPQNRTVILSIQAVVEPEIKLSESSLFFENVPAGKEVRKEILVTLSAAKEIKILSVVSDDPQVAVRLEPVPDSSGKQFKLIATQKATAKQGYHFGNIILRTAGSLTRQTAIYVLGTVVSSRK